MKGYGWMGRIRGVALLVAVALAGRAGHAQPRHAPACMAAVLEGEVRAGQEWKAPLGGGWVLRLVPIPPMLAGYTGWDLVVDRDPPAGFPDALLLATPPYNSINQREIGTTFGLRAQDAVGWNPRSFRFLANAAVLREAQRLYLSLYGPAGNRNLAAGEKARSTARLLELEKSSSGGELRIVGARLTPGVADPAPFAQGWAMAASRTGYEIIPGSATARGKLDWMHFQVTLWLPRGWRAAAGLREAPAACNR